LRIAGVIRKSPDTAPGTSRLCGSQRIATEAVARIAQLYAIEKTRTLTGCETERGAYVDKAYRGNNALKLLRVIISGQKRGVFGAVKRELNSAPPSGR
jgi:hypothetical protein